MGAAAASVGAEFGTADSVVDGVTAPAGTATAPVTPTSVTPSSTATQAPPEAVQTQPTQPATEPTTPVPAAAGGGAAVPP